mmetsp:Transcript_47719/g.114500  ORF Transcript_47719/g.114500 Transcript_47719/m.114500 type:complete len:245 (-) Transcript_47719:694-1428(-)
MSTLGVPLIWHVPAKSPERLKGGAGGARWGCASTYASHSRSACSMCIRLSSSPFLLSLSSSSRCSSLLACALALRLSSSLTLLRSRCLSHFIASTTVCRYPSAFDTGFPSSVSSTSPLKLKTSRIACTCGTTLWERKSRCRVSIGLRHLTSEMAFLRALSSVMLGRSSRPVIRDRQLLARFSTRSSGLASRPCMEARRLCWRSNTSSLVSAPSPSILSILFFPSIRMRSVGTCSSPWIAASWLL